MPMNLGLGLGLGSRGGGDIITSIFADGTDGFYFDFSKTDRLFQTVNGGAAADDAGENVALALESSKWQGRTFAQQISEQAELVTNNGFDSDVNNWTLNTTSGVGTMTWAAGKLRLEVTSGTFIIAYQSFPTVVGKRYTIAGGYTHVTGSGTFRGVRKADNAGSSSNVVTAVGETAAASNSGSASFVATAANTFVCLQLNMGGGGSTVDFDNISIKEIPGNHGLQATTAAQPKWQTSGLARFDGSDDTLLTTLAPAAAFTMMFKGTMTSASKAFMGSYGTVNVDNCYLITGGSGKLAGGLGTLGSSTILGGSDIRGVLGVGALAFGSSVWRLYWNGSEIATGAYVGGPTTTVPLMLGARNQNGTGGIFGDLDLHYALAIKKALTAAQIAAITNLWGTS